MDIFINYLIKNKEWIFSGLGIFVIGGIISLIKILINYIYLFNYLFISS